MTRCWCCITALLLCFGAWACGSSGGSTDAAGAAGKAGVTGSAGSHATTPPATSTPTGGKSSTPTSTATAGHGGSSSTSNAIAGSATAGAAGKNSAGAGNSSATGGKSSAGASAGDSAAQAGSGGAAGSGSGGSSITGTVGALGPAQPVLAAFTITNGPETLTYLSSAPLTCAQMMTMGTKWLSKLPAGSQVFEIVVRGTASAKMYTVGGVGGGEVHYAEGSKSSSTEASATAGSITFTQASMGGVHEGSFTSTFPSGMITGTFHAEWCQGGAEY